MNGQKFQVLMIEGAARAALSLTVQADNPEAAVDRVIELVRPRGACHFEVLSERGTLLLESWLAAEGESSEGNA